MQGKWNNLCTSLDSNICGIYIYFFRLNFPSAREACCSVCRAGLEEK